MRKASYGQISWHPFLPHPGHGFVEGSNDPHLDPTALGIGLGKP
jgi:hypothetical protein